MKAVACRAVWRVNNQDGKLANDLISSKRLRLEDIILRIEGVQFHISCVVSNKKGRTNATDIPGEICYPAIAMFIVYRPTERCSEDTLFSAMHNADLEPSITPITTKLGRGDMAEKAARDLFQVVKDHDNDRMEEMFRTSNSYCYLQAREELVSDTDGSRREKDQEETRPRHFPDTLCRLLVVNDRELLPQLQEAHRKLLLMVYSAICQSSTTSRGLIYQPVQAK